MGKKIYTGESGKTYSDPPKEVKEQFPDEFWSPDNIGDQIEGFILDKRPGKYGEFFCLTKDDESIVGLPTLVNLNTKLEKLEDKTRVRITFMEEKPTDQGRTFKQFKVEYWDK